MICALLRSCQHWNIVAFELCQLVLWHIAHFLQIFNSLKICDPFVGIVLPPYTRNGALWLFLHLVGWLLCFVLCHTHQGNHNVCNWAWPGLGMWIAILPWERPTSPWPSSSSTSAPWLSVGAVHILRNTIWFFWKTPPFNIVINCIILVVLVV